MKRRGPVGWPTGLGAAMLAAVPGIARASLLSPELVDKAADILAIVVLVIVPIIGIVVFWLVHVLPEKIAEKRHHPQTAAIQTLCLLSLVFGGLLWPIAWLWAYSKPVLYRVAYGTDKSEEYHEQKGKQALDGTLSAHELEHLRAELDAMAARGSLPPQLTQLRQKLDQAVGTTAVSAAPAREGGA